MFIREFVLKIKVAIVYAILKKLSNYSTISYERVSYIKCKSLFKEKQNEREQFELLLQEKNTPYVNQLLYRINENQNILGKVLYHLVRKFWKPMDTLFFHTAQIGEGLLINHGFSTIITAKSIGRNCLINQQVTIGVKNPGADRPKTQKSILKVEETHHSPDVLKDKVGINMNIEAVQDTKMENDRRSETVFGQSGGGTEDWE